MLKLRLLPPACALKPQLSHENASHASDAPFAPGQAGYLDAADELMVGVDAKTPDYSKTTCIVHVGHMAGRGTDQSVASFFDGPFRIVTDPEWVKRLQKKGHIDSDMELDESGIMPSQVISFDYQLQAPNIIYSLLYRDSEGRL